MGKLAVMSALTLFLDFINLKFACKPKDKKTAHRDATSYGDLDEIICWKIDRQIRNDWTIRYQNEYFQLREPNDKTLIKPGQFITLKKYLNGEIRFWVNDVHIKHGALSRKPEPPSRRKKYYAIKGPIDPIRQKQILQKARKNSSWKYSNAMMFNRNKKQNMLQNSLNQKI